ncbi:MAG TPA: BTAD domain-containing putative transcriptional regulator [Ktedonosporobacter sp.]|nr:BTAD domain-containing putative transcriptional regulator [Ktedonosporobacter sp.]
MSDASTLRKIRRPVLPPRMLLRSALVRWLDETIVGLSSEGTEGGSASRLLLLQAPAGYGKTTLLADFARATTIPCCWYVMDRSDTDTIIFLETLLTTIGQQFPSCSAMLDPLLQLARDGEASQPAEHRFDAVVEAVADTIATRISERFALILCNYHEVDACPSINRLIDRLLQLPSSCVLVLESRSLPNLNFAPLLVRREMAIISRDLLRLSAQEIQELARLQGISPLNDLEAEQLAIAFDGWMAGILLGTRLGDVRFLRRKMPREDSRLEKSSGKLLDGQHLFAYVAHEVFQRYPNEYAFLKEACVLEEMTAPLCAALLSLPIQEANARLVSLEQYGLFVRSEDSQRIATCHPALRDLLVENLRMGSPDRFSQLHRRAAELLGDEHNYEQAITHALAAGADELAADLIVRAFEPLTTQGHLETLARWMDAVPEPIKARSPTFLLSEARVSAFLGDSARALARSSAAREALTSPFSGVEVADQVLVQADIALARGVALCVQGRYQEAQVVCEQTLAFLPADEVKRRAEAQDCLGRCSLHLGDYPTALIHLQQALHVFSRHSNVLGTAAMHMSLNMVYRLLGNMVLAEHHCTRALACYEQIHNRRGLANAYLGLGSIRRSQGLLSEAETLFTQSLTLSREPILLHRLHAYALADLGELFVDQKRYDRALSLSEEALALAPGDALLCNTAFSTLARGYLFLGDVETARLMLSRMVLPAARGERIGKYQAEHDLIAGMILLSQQRPAKAYAILTETERALKTSGLKRLQIQTNLLIAVCHLEQDQMPEMLRRLEEVGTILTAYECFEQRVQVELLHLPALSQAIKTLPLSEAAHLRALFHLETHGQKQNVAVPLPASPSSVPAPPISLDEPRIGGRGEPRSDVLDLPPGPQVISVGQPATQPAGAEGRQGEEPTHIRIQAFGEPAVFLAEQPIVRWRMARALELFFYLLDCGRPLRKEQIIAALWPETDEQVDHTFHNTIYYVRKAIGEACVVLSRNMYTLQLTSLYGDQICYDVAQFETCYADAQRALAHKDDAAAAPALQAMIDLYRSDYLLPFYSNWCSLRRETLRTAYLDAHLHLAHLAWRSEAFEECVHHWQHIVAVDPYREEAHAGLIRCYLRQGKRGLAIRQYTRCRDTLRQELGIEPGPHIQRLYQYLSTAR